MVDNLTVHQSGGGGGGLLVEVEAGVEVGIGVFVGPWVGEGVLVGTTDPVMLVLTVQVPQPGNSKTNVPL